MLPLSLGSLDHYTLIVDDAAAVATFHEQVLGFEPLRVLKINAGSVPPGQYDMINHVLKIPDTDDQVLVITEGLSEDSIFSRYLRAYGPGVHHVAYEVDDIEAALAFMRSRGVKTTSSEVLRDPLTGLRQIFLDRVHGGYFIELIERTSAADSGTFVDENMAALAQTMTSYLEQDQGREEPPMPEVCIARPRAAVVGFMLDPFNLPAWTAHRTIRSIGGRVVEVRMSGDVALEISEHPGTPEIHFVWSRAGGEFRVRLAVEKALRSGETRVRALIPHLPPERAARTLGVIETELAVLKRLLEGEPEPATPQQRALLDAYHLEIYQRPGL
ncbi:MAG: VOC family protein [Myxococcales bacterium]|nr:VOC family protein [Myxococcales bacterium]